MPVLLSASEKLSNNQEIEVQWRKFNSEIKTEIKKLHSEIKIDERTQASRDLYQEVTQFILKADTSQRVTGGTNLRDQKNSNLCAYFATMSVLRHQLRKSIGDKKSGKGTTVLNYIENPDKKLFERKLTVMIGCVSPRSLAVKFRHFLIQI